MLFRRIACRRQIRHWRSNSHNRAARLSGCQATWKWGGLLPDGAIPRLAATLPHAQTDVAIAEGGAFILRKSSAADVSARIDALITRHYGGDRSLAAGRLDISPELLGGLLSGDWRRFSLDALIAVIRTHGVTIDWLLGSTSGSWDEVASGSRDWNATNIEPERLS
jgi:hypothetical protein